MTLNDLLVLSPRERRAALKGIARDAQWYLKSRRQPFGPDWMYCQVFTELLDPHLNELQEFEQVLCSMLREGARINEIRNKALEESEPMETSVIVQSHYFSGSFHLFNGALNLASFEFERAILLATPIFCELNSAAKCAAMGSAGSLGTILAIDGNNGAALRETRRAIDWGEPIFDELDAGGQGALLCAISTAARLFHEAGDINSALAENEHLVALGLPVYSRLSLNHKRVVHCAIDSCAGAYESRGDIGSALKIMHLGIEVGYPDYRKLDLNGKCRIIWWHSSAGAYHRINGNFPSLKKMYLRAIEIGDEIYEYLPVELREKMALLRHNLAQPNPNTQIGRAHVLRLLWQNAWLPAATLSKGVSPLKSLTLRSGSDLRQTDVLHFAKWWLTLFQAWPSKPSRPRQRRLVVQLCQALGSSNQHESARAISSWQQCLVKLSGNTSQGWGMFQLHIAAWITSQTLANQPRIVETDSAGGLLLARVRSVVASTDSWPESAVWRTDPSALYDAIGVKSAFLDDSSSGQRAPYWWLQHPSHPRLKVGAFGNLANETGGELATALSSWRAGDPGLACELLDQAWSMLGAGPEPGPDLAMLAKCLQALSIERAMPEAIDALIYGDTNLIVAGAVERWLGSRLAPLAAGTALEQARGLNQLLSDLLSGATGLPPIQWSKSDHQILERLHEYLQDIGPPGDVVVADRWQTLELQRFALASAATQQADRAPEPAVLEVADKALLGAFKVELAALGARLEAIEAGKPLRDPDPDNDDITYGLLEELARQCDLQNLRVELPAPGVCRSALHDGESLVQVWFDGIGQAHALILSDADLINQPLSASLQLDAWQPLLDQWDALRTMPMAAWDSSQKVYEVYAPEDPHAESYRVALAAWNRFVAADSPASVLLAELFAAPPVKTISLILPTQLARLPWLARAVSGTVADRGDFEPGRIVLEASVSSWLMARQARVKDNEASALSAAPGHVVYTPAPLKVALDKTRTVSIPFGEIEADKVGRSLGVQALAAEGPVELIRALHSPGAVHLCLHGNFDPFDPMKSFLALDHECQTLPLWLLQGTNIKGDLSLSACQAMLVGSAPNTPWAGPVGIGPLLRARGARSVLGPLGINNALASWIFFELWYQARREVTAIQALARAQQQMREMTLQDARARIESVSDLAHRQALDQILLRMVPDGGGPPFANPASWAQFVLLGDAPAFQACAESVRNKWSVQGWIRKTLGWLALVRQVVTPQFSIATTYPIRKTKYRRFAPSEATVNRPA